MEDVMKNVKPTIVGRIRKEAFGGIYYERDRLVIELLNDSAYEILSLCQQGKTQEEIEQYLLSEYEADPHLIKDDLQEYLENPYHVKGTIFVVCMKGSMEVTLNYGKYIVRNRRFLLI